MPYTRPPITEAVIELRFGAPASEGQLDRAANSAAKSYFLREAEVGRSFEFNAITGNATSNVDWTGVKFSSMDRTETLILRTDVFLSSQLAPYRGWDAFFERAKRDWDQISDLPYGKRTVSRIGVRFINRIDVPGALKREIDPQEYLAIGVALPKVEWGSMKHYFVQVARSLDQDGCSITINTGTTPSPLIGHQSIVLDIDIYNDSSVPQREGAWDLIMRIRELKNRVFEASITDAARALFD
jgi:uncharacterized protein (TIGR04255 family)